MTDSMESPNALEMQPEDAPAFSPHDLTKAQNELDVYSSASRAILLHLCQRIGRLEITFRTMQNDVFRIRSDLNKGTTQIKDDVTGIHDQVQTLSSRLHDVASVVDLFQSEMNSHKTQVTTLTTSVDDERERLSAVDVKVDNQRDEFDTRIQELHLKLDELPRALAALQMTGGRDPFAGFTFRTADRDKLSLGKHIDRGDAAHRKGGPPFTDLQPFTIPDDMKAKIEMKIRQREASKSDLDKRAAAELADAYRRLQLAGYPRVTEIHMNVAQCRDDIERAFNFIRQSNLQLYACCESKVERVDLMSIQHELRSLRNRVRDFETRKKSLADSPPHISSSGDYTGNVLSTWNLDKYFDRVISKEDSANNRSVHVSTAQVPELRVSLLEMTKALHTLRQEYAKNHVQPLNPTVKKHLEKLTTALNDGYSLMAEEPFDMERIEVYVEKTARLLGSEYTQHALCMMMTIPDSQQDGNVGSDDVASALDRYARTFSHAAGTTGSGNAPGGAKASPPAHHAATMRVIQDQKKQIEQLRAELEKVVESQRHIEATLTVPGTAHFTTTTSTTVEASSTMELRLVTQQQQLYGLQEQLMLLHRQARVQEDAFGELVRQVDQWRKERAPIGGITGQRVGGAVPVAHAVVQHGLPLSSALRRSNSGNSNGSGDLDAYLAITAVDQGDRPKSQMKLDPLHVQRSSGSSTTIPTTGRSTSLSVPVSVPVARNGVVHKIQSRAQVLRPKSGLHHDGG